MQLSFPGSHRARGCTEDGAFLPEILEQFEFPSLCSTIAGAFEAVESLDNTSVKTIAREREVPIEHVLMPMEASKIQVPVNV
jgi:hypothetical protein